MNRAYRQRKQHLPLAPCLEAWNADPDGGAWTGFDDLIAQMHAGEPMAERPCVLPCTPEQYAAYHKLQNVAIALGYERRPPAAHGLGMIHIHMEKRT